MAYNSSFRYARISARKARLVADMIRGKSYTDAVALLGLSKKRAAVFVRKVLETAAANASDQGEIRNRDLIVTGTRVDEGPTIKRFQEKDRGRAHSILKRTSHIHLVVDER